jgi:hypothetical protein
MAVTVSLLLNGSFVGDEYGCRFFHLARLAGKGVEDHMDGRVG